MGYPIHPISFRVGKTLPWNFPLHHYRSDRFVNLALLNNISLVLRRRLLRSLPPTRSGFIPDLPRIRWNGRFFVIILPFFNSAYDIYLRQFCRKFRLSRRLVKKTPKRWGRRPRVRVRRRRWRSRFANRGVHRNRVLRALRSKRRYFTTLRTRPLRKALPLVRKYHGLRRPIYVAPRKVYVQRTWRKPRRVVVPRRKLSIRLYRRRFGRRPETQIFARKYRSRFRRGRSSLGFFRGFFPNWVQGLRQELRRQLPANCPIAVRLLHRSFNTITARHLALYIIRRLRLNYKVNRIVFPLMAEARRSPAIKGIFFKFKGRLTRKARASLNTRVMRYGKIGFSTLTSRVDYCSMPFRTRYGTCTVQVWLSRRSAHPIQRRLHRILARDRAAARFLHFVQPGRRNGRKFVGSQMLQYYFDLHGHSLFDKTPA